MAGLLSAALSCLARKPAASAGFHEALLQNIHDCVMQLRANGPSEDTHSLWHEAGGAGDECVVCGFDLGKRVLWPPLTTHQK
jgi:hypothetical protein